ncbi:MAG: helix-turn-helix transcriptional regulator [Candidatus Aminicenantes bacterium]|nr:helix-turn-helix transcriptional regulator [Candidatus Aminicenantes bacterium]
MSNDDLKEFAERLKKVRESLGFNRLNFGKSIGISKSVYSNIEAAITKPTFPLFLNISRVHNVNLRFLLHGEGDMFHQELDADVKEMLELFEVPAIRLQVMSDFNRAKEVFKPLINFE